ncbi:mevalonate kinase [Venturia canescens]|uniref:mevalonate kinase n=1 Tax=Venturia canescens TaxID=32260 RepID=UPI001C9D5BA0|nr:mevalonate kinase [Venturia canescens]
MTEFRVSAPGKIILHGEHAVVYGKTAVAASVDIRTTLDFKELPEDCEYAVLSMPKIGLYVNVSVKQIRERFYTEACSKLSDGHETFHNYVAKFVEKIGYTNFQQKFALEGVFYLLVSISQFESIELRPFQMVLDTALTIGAGLGSSASFSVCLATAFIHWSHKQKNQTTLMDEQQLETISRYALNGEKIMHGNPSGLDNSISTFGSVIEFRRGEPLKQIPGVKSMRALLVDTRVQRSTKALVEKFFTLKEKYPMIFLPILDSMDYVAKKAIEVLKNIQTTPDSTDESLYSAYKELMVMIEVNHGLLATCQVSHQSLDTICAEAKNYGLAGKLTGAGGGGYAYILLLPDTPTETITSITTKLTANGYPVTLVTLGGVGVKIHET